jgi:hypothetical protein
MNKDTIIKVAAIAFYGMCIATTVALIFDCAPKFLVDLCMGALSAHSYCEIKRWWKWSDL